MKVNKTLGVILATGALLVVLGACQKQEGPAEQAGKKLDNAVEQSGKEASKAMEKLGEKVEKTGENIQDAAKSDKK